MLRPYQRRAFLVIAFAGLVPGSAAAQESLWDVLGRADKATPEPAKTASGTAAGTANGSAPSAAPAPPRPATESLWDVLTHANADSIATAQVNIITPATLRRPLGPVPGFTLPAPKRATEEQMSLFGKNKKSRGFLGQTGEWFNNWMNSTGTKVKVTGYHTFSFRAENITGNADAFRSDQYFGRGNNGLYSDTDLTVDATLFKHFHYETRLSNSLFNNPNDPNNNRVRLNYKTERLGIEWGNINAGFQGNSLIDFNRYLHGMQITNRWGSNFNTSILYSQTRAETRTITIPGNNSTGPFYVYAGQIVEGSDRVRINERELQKGRDYSLDTYTGELNLLNGRIALQTDAIAVTFETVGFNQQRGTIYGLRAEYTPKGSSRFGLTYVTQQAQGTTGLQTRTQQFYGFGAPNAPYLLDSPVDTTKPILVSIAGVPLVQGTEWVLDTTLSNQIRIAQAVPPTAIIQVQYVPLNTTPVPGNRTVLGLDGRISLGKLGSLTTELALSGLSLSGSNIGGNAFQVRADLAPLRNLTTSITLRNISPTFSSIQSPGFNRNEKSIDFSADYALSTNTRVNFNMQKAKRPSYSSGFGVSQFTVATNGEDDYDQSGFSITNTFGFNLAKRVKKAPGEGEAGQQDAAALLPVSKRPYSMDEDRLPELTPEEGAPLPTVGIITEATEPTEIAGIGPGAQKKTLTPFEKRQRELSKGNLTGTLSFTRSSLGSRYFAGGGTKNTNDSILLNVAFRALTFNLGVTRNQNTADAIYDLGAGTGTQVLNSQSSTQGNQFGLAWQPFKWLQLSTSLSNNDITSRSNDQFNQTTARDTQFSAHFTPSSSIRFRYTYQLSDTGNLFNPTDPTDTDGEDDDDVIGTPSRSAFFPWRTRQASTTNNSGLNNFGANTYGGGNFNNIGGFGNYSGIYGNNFNNGYGVSSFGGKSRSNIFSLDWTLKANMALGIQYTNASSVGDYQYNSNRNNLNFNFNWQPSDRLQLNLSQGFQNVAYNGSLGGTNSTSTLLSLSGRPFGGKLNMQIAWQSVQTKSNLDYSALNPGSGSETTPPVDTSLSLNSLSARMDYPLSSRYTLFAEFFNTSSVGYLGSLESQLRFGVDYALMRNLKFSLGWQIFNRNYSDTEYAQYNYKVSTILAELGFRF